MGAKKLRYRCGGRSSRVITGLLKQSVCGYKRLGRNVVYGLAAFCLSACNAVESTDKPVVSAAPREALTNPEMFAINREPARASFFAYENDALAAAGNPQNSARFLSLNGKWKFHWVSKPADRPADFYREDFDDSGWASIEVPGNIERQGYGTPHYVNIDYVFPANQPLIPADYNPVGSYVKTFTLPETWRDHQVYIHLGAVNSAFYIYLNGHEIGYSEDAKLPAEFDLSPYLQPGQNRLAVEVYRWADGSYLEDQDGWSLSGIERDVYLFARPHIHIQDFAITADWDPQHQQGTLVASVDIAGKRKLAENHSLQLTLSDGETVLYRADKPVADPGQSVGFRRELPAIAPWSAEAPKLYNLSLVLQDGAGKVVEAVSQTVGFRRAEMRAGQFVVNGRAITLRGVNRVEHHPTRGRAVTRQIMEQDMRLMKENNINAVRTSHFPNDPYWYELADRYGLYILDEANIESHQYRDMGDAKPRELVTTSDEAYRAKFQLGYQPEWIAAHLARVSRMVERDKNHPSVVLWSLGNEAGMGPAFEQATRWIRANDPSRPVTYGGNGQGLEHYSYVDIYTPMYLPPDAMADYVKVPRDKPMIQLEYAHAMGNSMGALDAYWALIYAEPQLQGGFIWDWVDQTFLETDDRGRHYWGYGGDYNDGRNDGNFLANGLIQSDRTPNPHLAQVKKVYQPIYFTGFDEQAGTLEIASHYDFVDTAHLRYEYVIQEDGVDIQSGTLALPVIKAGETRRVELSVPAFSKVPGREYHLMIRALQAQQENLAPEGHLIAWGQFPLASAGAMAAAAKVEGALQLKNQGGYTEISGNGFAMRFSRQSGVLTSLKVQGIEVIEEGPTGNFWRIPTDNDRGWGMYYKLAVWNDASVNRRLENFEVSQVGSSQVDVKTAFTLGDNLATFELNYTIQANGDTDIEARLVPQKVLPIIPRVGLQLQMPAGFQALAWFGRGPGESYSDRKSGYPIGRYQGRVKDQLHDYSRPQETGNKTDVRWVSLTNEQGVGLKVKAAEPFGFSAVPLTQYALYDFDRVPRHVSELDVDEVVTLRLDYLQMGVGGDDSWGAKPHGEFLIPSRPYQFEFKLELLGRQ